MSAWTITDPTWKAIAEDDRLASARRKLSIHEIRLIVGHAKRRYEPEALNDDGWSDWIKPLPGYVLQCCDCGSLHKMEFAVEDGAVVFRAKPIEHSDSDGTASAALCEDIAVPKDCQARAVRHRQEAVTHRPIRRENNG